MSGALGRAQASSKLKVITNYRTIITFIKKLVSLRIQKIPVSPAVHHLTIVSNTTTATMRPHNFIKLFSLQLLFVRAGMALSQPHGNEGISSTSEFATKLFSVLCSDGSTKGENILISPLSIIQSLALIKDGATVHSENYRQLTDLLGATVLEAARTLHESSLGDSSDKQKNGVELNIATSLWTDSIKQQYWDLAKSKHFADVFPLQKQHLFASINRWVSDHTNGMIKDLFDRSTPVDPNMVAVLVNAVHFKGSWLKKFDESKTSDGEFYSKSNNLPARFMSASRKMHVIEYAKELGGASVLVLDYGEEEVGNVPEFSAVFMLPADSSEESMNALIRGLSQPMSTIIEKAHTSDVRLKLPRFKLKFGPSSLSDALKKLGMTDAFDSTKSELFNEMTNDPRTFVDDIFHGAAMEVTEEGTVAAAATGVMMATRSLVIPLELTFNRPFVVAVVHRPSGLPLFLGRVEKPELMFDNKSGADEL
jgi:serine protease inhibitor